MEEGGEKVSSAPKESLRKRDPFLFSSLRAREKRKGILPFFFPSFLFGRSHLLSVLFPIRSGEEEGGGGERGIVFRLIGAD